MILTAGVLASQYGQKLTQQMLQNAHTGPDKFEKT